MLIIEDVNVFHANFPFLIGMDLLGKHEIYVDNLKIVKCCLKLGFENFSNESAATFICLGIPIEKYYTPDKN